MRWGSLGTLAKVTVTALVAATLAHLVSTATLGEYNTSALVFQLVLLGLAGLASTGRWWALALTGLMGGLLAIATAVGQAERLTEVGEMGEFAGVLSFLVLTVTAAIAGTAATLQAYRESHPSLPTEQTRP